MTQQKQKPTAAEAVAWTENLPEGGGAWGKSIRSTAEQMEHELVELERLKAEVSEKVSGRKKILGETMKRASKEAALLYSNKAIEAALAKSKTKRSADKNANVGKPEASGSGAHP